MPAETLPCPSSELEREAGRLLAAEAPVAFFCIGIDRLKDYGEAYGLSRRQLVVRETAEILARSLRESAGPEAFLARVEPGHFAALTSPRQAPFAAQRIVTRFDDFAPLFFNPQDRGRGFALWRDEGRPRRLPFLTLSIGIVTNERRKLATFGQALAAAAEVKARLNGRARGALSRFSFDRDFPARLA